MRHYVYIQYSAALDRYYTGLSRYVGKRKRQHLKGQTYWTSGADDWQERWRQDLSTLEEARALEKRIKARGARRFFADIGALEETYP